MRKNNSKIFQKLTNSKQNSKVNEQRSEKTNKSNELKLEKFAITDFTANSIAWEESYTGTPEAIQKNFRDQPKVLEQRTPKEIFDKINHYRQLDLKTVSDNELLDILTDIVNFNSVSFFTIPENENIYRARHKEFQRGTAYDFFRDASEIWYPKPEHLKKPGRLNNAGQPMMYASLDALTPIHEIRSENETQFALMKYKIKTGEKLELALIAVEDNTAFASKIKKYNNLSNKAKKNWKIINDFLVSEFTKKIPWGEEYKYRSTNALLRAFNAPGCDGFLYPSIERGKGYNLAIKPEAADRAIEFTGLAYWLNKNYDKNKVNKRDFYCLQQWSKSIEKGKIAYEPIGPCTIDFEGLGSGIVAADETVYFQF